MADDVLDQLYWVKPEDFTAVRSRLAAAAKQRGDGALARQIAACRKPTTAAWVVNRLALSRSEAKQRLTELGQRLRAAHAGMDGHQIRELSAAQRSLIDELSRAAFDAAEITDPSAVLREDVTGTLQAAIADPDVAARLGRLAKAERWSGFGDFGVTAPVSTVTRGAKTRGAKAGGPGPEPARHEPAPASDDDKAARQEFQRAGAALADAERARADADAALSERHTELVSARWRHQEARKRLDEAERDLHAAEEAHDGARQTSRKAAELVNEAKGALKRARA
jgi:hypothetical protein